MARLKEAMEPQSPGWRRRRDGCPASERKRAGEASLGERRPFAAPQIFNYGRLQGRDPLRRPIKFMITTTRKMMRNT